MQPDRAFVVECYRRILGREPESEAIVDQVLGSSDDIWTLLTKFTHSHEFTLRTARMSSHSLCKAFDPRYLATDLSDSDRVRSLLTTYGSFGRDFKFPVLRQLFTSSLPLLNSIAGDAGVTVTAALFDGSRNEGEVSLIVHFEARRVAVLTYTRAPADIFGLGGDDVLLISRIQGYLGAEADTWTLTRRLNGISPPYLLMAVLEGVAAAQSCTRMVGVGAHQHPHYRPDEHESFVSAYDALFLSLKATQLSNGFFMLTSPLEGRPLASIKRSHRARTKRKREVKRAIAREACEQWRSYLVDEAVVSF